MPKYKDYLDELFIDKLGYQPDFQLLAKPVTDGSDNLIALSRDYIHGNISVIVAECKDRIPVFQKQIIKEYKKTYPDAHFLFISNNGKVYDLYNYSTSKKLKAITYNEIERNTKLFKEKVQFFNASSIDGSADLKVQIERAFETTDKITKKFYDNFKGIHDKLTNGIEGIEDEHDKKWYATTLLNRLMFIFFLQKNKVLQGDTDFLITKYNQATQGNNNYFTHFLLPLFFKGFAKKDTDLEKATFVKQFGQVKYLNGGLFYPNKIEFKYATVITTKVQGFKLTEKDGTNPQINISNSVLFEVISFLNGYTWYLDNRPTKDEKEINPDVLGYIFEKYINQKELGAYYTKEDITEYISKNTIIPFILDKLRKNGYDAPNPTPLITNNEDIKQVAETYIANCTNYQTIKFLYTNVLLPMSVLDPSVGSGAFLFAALNILLPIYQATIAKLKTFKHTQKDEWLHQLLQNISTHPEEYFLTKQIILNNLYGVDIVDEAVEICKLRLFLQLASHLADITALEPLPDIDFNIYAGNSLVGGLSMKDLQGTYGLTLFTKDGKGFTEDELLQTISQLQTTKKQYKLLQNDDNDELLLKQTKSKIQALETRVNYLINIGIDNPFHWFIEYAEIFERGGFDVIIGNPPYVEYSKVKKDYEVKGYETISTANLYPFFIERSIRFLNKNGKCGMIIPISAFANQSMKSLQLYLKTYKNLFISSFHQRPAQLFDGVLQRLSIFLLTNEKTNSSIDNKIYTSKVYRWYSEERKNLFQAIRYISIPQDQQNHIIKVENEIEESIYNKFFSHIEITNYLNFSTINNNNFISYRTAGGGYWWTFLNTEFETNSLSNKLAYFNKEYDARVFTSILSSNLFWWYYYINYDLFNLKDYMIFSFRFNYPKDNFIINKLIELSKKLQNDLLRNAHKYQINSKTRGVIETVTYRNSKSKHIIDEIDTVLAQHYGFTQEELNFIINYDLRFRMGSNDEEE